MPVRSELITTPKQEKRVQAEHYSYILIQTTAWMAGVLFIYRGKIMSGA